MTALVVGIDFLIFYLTFSYQRATLNIARQLGESPGKNTANVQASLTPALIGALGWLNWLTLATACYLLWQIAWWYAPLYAIGRFVLPGLLPLIPFDAYIVGRAKRAMKKR